MNSKVWVTKEYEYIYKKEGKLLQRDLYRMRKLHNCHFGHVYSIEQKKKLCLGNVYLTLLSFSDYVIHYGSKDFK